MRFFLQQHSLFQKIRKCHPDSTVRGSGRGCQLDGFHASIRNRYFAPLFGIMVDKAGKGTRWMVLGAILAFIAHMLLAFAPAGRPIFGYLSMIFLGFGYSLVPAAMWPGVPKIVPDKVLGTAYSLIYWVQNLGLMFFKMSAGGILESSAVETGPVKVELMFVGVCIVSILLSVGLAISSGKHPEYKLDAPSGK